MSLPSVAVSYNKLTDFTPLDPAIVATLGAPPLNENWTKKNQTPRETELTILEDAIDLTIVEIDGEHQAHFRPETVTPEHIRIVLAGLGLEEIDDIEANHASGYLALTCASEE